MKKDKDVSGKGDTSSRRNQRRVDGVSNGRDVNSQIPRQRVLRRGERV